ncbi:hypothetical protein VIGAN_01347100, partial [Vigna angularis var. angularis]
FCSFSQAFSPSPQHKRQLHKPLSSLICASSSCRPVFFYLVGTGLSSFLLHICSSSFSGTELRFSILHCPSQWTMKINCV